MSDKAPRGMSAGAKLLIAAALFIAAAIASYVYTNVTGAGENREWRMVDTRKGVSYDFDASPSFYSFDTRFFYFCTKDGMKYVSSSGDIKWQEIFNLTKPIPSYRGDMAAIGETRGKHIYVFDANGLAYDVSFDNPVLTFSVNRSGYLAAIVQQDKGYAVNVYNRRNAAMPLCYYVFQDAMFMPMTADVSEDGRFTAIAMLDINVRESSRVSFYYTNKQDAWATEDGMFAFENYPGEIVLCVRFMSDNQVLVFTDTRIVCYKLGDANAKDEVWSVPLYNKIDLLAFYSDSRFAYVTGERLLNEDEAADPGIVRIYSINGDVTGEFALGRKATYLYMGYDAVIVGADRIFYALNNRGDRLWEYTCLQDTRDMLFLDNTDTVLMAGGMQATVLKRTRVKTAVQPDESIFDAEAEQSASPEAN